MKKRKLVLAWLVTLCMIVALMPVTVMAKDSFYPTISGPAFGSEYPLGEGKYYLLNETGAPIETGASAENYNVYYHDTTVTLKNAHIKTGFYIPGGTTIELLGENTVSNESGRSAGIQVMTEGFLNVKGSGSCVFTSPEGLLNDYGNILIQGGKLDLQSVSSSIVSQGDVTINGNADVIAKKITAEKDIEIAGQAIVNATSIRASKNAILTGNSKITVNGDGIEGNSGLELQENVEVSSTSTGNALNSFYGPITINSSQKVIANSTSTRTASISAGTQQNTESHDIKISSDVEVSGFVGIGVNGDASKIVINGGTVKVDAAFIGIYTQSTGTVDILNGADVTVVGKGNQTPGIATFSKTPQPINIKNSTIHVSNCGYGLSGSKINIEESDVTVSSNVRAFLKTPDLMYKVTPGILYGESADSVQLISGDASTEETYQNKYIKIVSAPDVNQIKITTDVKVKTAGENVNAGVEEASEALLKKECKSIMDDILNGKTPDGVSQNEVNNIRKLLFSGMGLYEANLTVYVDYAGDSQDVVPQAIKQELKESEEAQIWNLRVELALSSKDQDGKKVDSVENISVTRLSSPIDFQLNTGKNFTDKTVRVLYIHDDAIKTADSKVVNAEQGIVYVNASEFSPYVVLSKSIEKDSADPSKPTGDNQNGNTNGNNAVGSNGTKTGDQTPIGLLAVLMMAAAAGIAFCGRKLYKSR